MLRLHIQGVPIHPALVHFPVALWSLAAAAQAAALVFDHAGLWAMGYWLVLLGVIFGALAAATGVLEFADRRRFPRHSPAFHMAFAHMRWMAAAWNCFAIELALVQAQPPSSTIGAIALGLSLTGFACMTWGAHQAGRLVHSPQGLHATYQDHHGH
ncbi:DUF2231 domain-containing protein [Spectribacter hydrogenooxidans]|uniref:DUF2231 domain-containing protein n=1 Tax=Spectribacter hydrogenoxidans TaxID=3075608 RepID=A0ABU3C2B9_9GAMM|nr:DUF2231 domain-containing protein [Salinisphaera sp. W335]MDT0635699.1 DUF2231 domain-containing protein [Salinisphaera sp. W335]